MSRSVAGRTKVLSSVCNIDRCERPSLVDAPVAICAHHAREVYEFGRDLVAANTQERIPDPIVERFAAYSDYPRKTTYVSGGNLTVNRSGTPGVYYVRLNDMIKIGRSADVQRRVRTYPPGSVLLAVEVTTNPVELEKRRLAQFRHCRRGKGGRSVAGEWHEATPELMEHIGTIAACSPSGTP